MTEEYWVGAVTAGELCGWGTYRRKPDGGAQLVKSPKLPVRGGPNDEEAQAQARRDLDVWLAERAPMDRQSRARRAAKLAKQAETQERKAQQASDSVATLGHRHAAQRLRYEAWAELVMGLDNPCHPDIPLIKVGVRELAGALGSPPRLDEVLAAYGQEGAER